ncbi:hypothetical protein [Leuconostoc lactis]|uniref:hypothetical protein n=1 Tax=Leuconostoc lactis TaxID=1246 RepID=UPI0021A8DEB1|nr:hypothetical protein [Leuconostoc lactis]MCT3116119.1 hypothetical protein [Leuconostoc lactis]
MTEPVAYMWKTERRTILGFTQNDDIHSGGQLGIPLYTADQLHSMKWFVRTKEFDDDGYKVLEDIRLDYYEYGNVKNDEETAEYGHPFDTKEEAEKWTNPLTEAVQLPVDGE